MTAYRFKTLAAAATLAMASSLASATVVDATGDFIASFTGAKGADLDVISAGVLYNPGAQMFTLSATMAGNIGTTPGGIYVWGVNRGAGVATFAPIGATNVLFDAVIVINGDGSVRANGTNLPAGTAHFDAASITLDLSESLLPSRGFGVTDYTWNLWPRDSRVVGTAAISDFAPDNSNLVTSVPEPGSAALGLLGIALLAGVRRKAA